MGWKSGWIGVDWDRTLVEYHTDPAGYNPLKMGAPLWPMVERVKNWIAEGKTVKIFSARASGFDLDTVEGKAAKALVIDAMQNHMEDVLGLPRLEVTCEKDYLCNEIWDDIAVTMVPNTGRPGVRL